MQIGTSCNNFKGGMRMTQTKELATNREFKSRLFSMIFSEKKELLELYNAMSGKNYKNPELLEINTLENAIYMSMKNDLSFIIYMRLNLYEQQSTFNPNMPLRDLFYVADMYSALVKGENLYGTKLIKIPTPMFVVFYNGEKEIPDRKIMKLSDAYSVKDEEVWLELKVLMLNINYGHNEKLLQACKTLGDYSKYTHCVREYAKIMNTKNAVECAVRDCIKEGVLKEFLEKNRAEVIKMSIYEYDEARHMQMEREQAKEEGFEEGRAEGRAEGHALMGCKMIRKLSKIMKPTDMVDLVEWPEDRICQVIELITECPKLTDEEIAEKLGIL